MPEPALTSAQIESLAHAGAHPHDPSAREGVPRA
jgi:hypothetical protein